MRVNTEGGSQNVKGNVSFPPDHVEGNNDCFLCNHNLIVSVICQYCFIISGVQLCLKVNLKRVLYFPTAPRKKCEGVKPAEIICKLQKQYGKDV